MSLEATLLVLREAARMVQTPGDVGRVAAVVELLLGVVEGAQDGQSRAIFLARSVREDGRSSEREG